MRGGYAELARLNAEHIVPLPKGMTLKQAMGIGTADLLRCSPRWPSNVTG